MFICTQSCGHAGFGQVVACVCRLQTWPNCACGSGCSLHFLSFRRKVALSLLASVLLWKFTNDKTAVQAKKKKSHVLISLQIWAGRVRIKSAQLVCKSCKFDVFSPWRPVHIPWCASLYPVSPSRCHGKSTRDTERWALPRPLGRPAHLQTNCYVDFKLPLWSFLKAADFQFCQLYQAN